MKISWQWLLELTGLDWSAEEVAERLTLSGTACEDIVPTARFMENVIVGEVTDLQGVEGADKIRQATVDTGSEKLQVVCGAPNVAKGQKIAFAQIDARLAGDFVIKKAKIRGVESFGMICSQRELGVTEDHTGIWVLPDDAPVGQPLADYLDFNDFILDFELTPDRADSMSAIGIARDLACLGGTQITYPTWDLKSTGRDVAASMKVSSDDPEACPRFTARIIRDVKIGPSPWWLQKKLITAGIRPISNIVDVTNYVMLETGNPVHAFDLDKFGSHEVVVRRARDGEELITLDEKKHRCTSEVLLITNGKEAKAAAGVMGGYDSEVTDETRNILLEVAYFSPTVIRKSRKQLGFISEASQRFEKGVDPNNLEHASGRVAHLFQEVCGGSVDDGIVDCYPNQISPSIVSFRPERCNAILGTGIKTERMKAIFRGLEFEMEGDQPIKVTAPTFRHDIEKEIDLIEEIARVEGFDSIPDSTENIGPLFTPTHRGDEFEDDLRTTMTGLGFDEMVNHGLADSRQAELVSPGVPQLRIVNPVSEDLDIMRNSLVLTALTVVSHNIAHRNLDQCLFEIGKAYFPPNEKGEWREEDRLLLLATGRSQATWRERPRDYDFYDISGALSHLQRHFHWPRLTYEASETSSFEPAISFAVKTNGHQIGQIGQIKDKITEKFDIKQPVYLAELHISDLIALSREQIEYTPLPVFPAALRDLAIVVDESARVGDMIAMIRSTAGDLAESVDIFDFYTGKQIQSGKKSIGVAITYRSPDRSLSSEEVDKIQDDIVAALKKNFKAEIRDK